MPFTLLIIGIWLLVAGVRNTAGPASQPGTLFALIHGDFTGSDNFVYWFVAILLIGAIGYIPKLKPLSTAFLVLVIVVLILKKGSSTSLGGGFFGQFLSGIGITQNTSGTGITANAANLAATQAALNNVTAAGQANFPNLVATEPSY